MKEMKIFSGTAHPALAQKICEYLGIPTGRISIGRFPDGEISCKIDEDVRGRDVFIIQPTCPPVNDNLMQLLVMIDSFVRASAARITAVLPYYGYARQDRKDEGRVPITAKLVANLITRARRIGPWLWTCTPIRFKVSLTSRSITSTRRRCSTRISPTCEFPANG